MTADTKYRPLVLPLPRSHINLHLDGTFESLRIIDLQTFPTVEDEYELGDIIVVGLKDYVFDVTALKEYFGPNSPLSHYASNDISYALIKYSNLPEDTNVEGYMDLSPEELEVLDNWVSIFLHETLRGHW
ncbi:hypothetical protein B0H10DRAFT_2233516 [Mycena sp. CBHHK59/15]|nr:hypothetical protein B0H10DRAFT_2233516 [Mycena sp. CBHHK59/15]